MKQVKRPHFGFRRILLMLVPIAVACAIILYSEWSKPLSTPQIPYPPAPMESDGIAVGTPAPDVSPRTEDTAASDAIIGELYDTRQSDVQVQGAGTVMRILEDDTEGDRHQRFILELGSGQTLLVAHNIDIAPRLEGLQTGDIVQFYGEYVYNDEGGVIHWTHRDPGGRHVDGWLTWNGAVYQ